MSITRDGRLPTASMSQVRLRKKFLTLEEWEEKAEPYYQASYNNGGSQRSCYDMRGQSLFMETHVPWSAFKRISVVHKLTDFNVTKDSDDMKLAEKFGGEWEEGYYAEPGYGWPVFAEARHAWDFLVARENNKKGEPDAVTSAHDKQAKEKSDDSDE